MYVSDTIPELWHLMGDRQHRRNGSSVHVQGGLVCRIHCGGGFFHDISFRYPTYVAQEEFIKRFVQAGYRESCNDRRSAVHYRDMGEWHTVYSPLAHVENSSTNQPRQSCNIKNSCFSKVKLVCRIPVVRPV